MLTFYHAPWSRSSTILWVLEELGVDYRMELIDIRGEGGAPEDYRAIQPNKKVPAIDHDGTVVTERAAITLYLGDAFPQAGLTPALTDRDRAPYLTALVYHDAVFDPVICAKMHGLSYIGNAYPFGLYDDMVANLERILAARPWMAGDRFTLADVIFGSGMHYTMTMMKTLPPLPVFQDYVARATDRPACKRSMEKDAALAADIPALRQMMAGGGPA